MTKQKTVFSSPYFWVAVGGLGLAYYLYKKKNTSTVPTLPDVPKSPTSSASESPTANGGTNFQPASSTTKF